MNTAITDPQTWNDAAAAAVSKIVDYPGGPGESIIEIRMTFTNLEKNYPEMPKSMSLFWAAVGHSAYRFAANSGNGFTPDELIETLIRKQRDYGHENIRRFGDYGVIVRCHDKIARLENLTSNMLEPNNESLKDNLLDVAGYSAIGIMLDNDWFMKQLA